MFINKTTRGETKVIDADKGTVSAVASTESRDRDGDIIRADGWQLDNFMRHPILLSSHNYGSVKNQIGEWESIGVRGRKLQGVVRYYIGEGNEEADWAFKLASKGRAAYSVGFIPDMEKAVELKGGKGYEFKGQELLEISHVTVPSNPTALQVVRSIAHPDVQDIIDEQIAELAEAIQGEVNEEQEHRATCCETAIIAEYRLLLRAIIAESGSDHLDSGADSDKPESLDILSLIGGNHA